MKTLWDYLGTIPHCVMFGRPWMALVHVVGNVLIFLAYMAIPMAIEVVRRERHLPFSGLAALFSAFILLCGITHLLHLTAVLSANAAWYWVTAVFGVLTGVVSMVTAVYAFRLIPTLLSIPTPEQHEFQKERLKIYQELENWRQNGKPKLQGRIGKL